MNFLRLYGRYIAVFLISKLEYGVYYLMDFVINVVFSFISLLMVWILLDKFGAIRGWNFNQILFLYNINYFSFAFSAMFVWNPARELGNMVWEGSFDGVLVKPLDPFVHLVIRQFSHGHLVQVFFGIGVFIYCLPKLLIAWTVAKFLWFIIVIMGAIMIHSAVMIMAGAVSFWFVKSNAILDVILQGLRNFQNYPVNIYSKWVQVVLTFVIPYAFVNFYPAQFFLGKTDEYLFHPAFQFLTPAVGLVGLVIAWLVWHRGLRKYEGTGS